MKNDAIPGAKGVSHEHFVAFNKTLRNLHSSRRKNGRWSLHDGFPFDSSTARKPGISNSFMSTCVKAEQAEIRIAGRTLYVPSAEICGRTVVVTGNWLRKAAVKDENLVEGEIIDDPTAFVEGMRESPLRADILTFAQKLPETTPKYTYDFEWDNWAVIPITTFDAWWEKRLPQESRRNIRRAAKRGVAVKIAQFDDELVKGIQDIYNETPIRQGRRFWHFGKDFDTVKRENGTYLDRSEFLGAYLNEELIGFIKIIYVDQIATLIQILSKNEHWDKRPVNAMLAKAVEVCAKRDISFLIYGKYVYDRNENSSLTEFKRRNGFEEIRFPRYFLPLGAKGRLAFQLGLHRGVKGVIPPPVANLLRHARSQFYRHRYSARKSLPHTVSSVQ
jgi:hypothetical protein